MSEDPADLNNLHDIVLPEAVSWWPFAPGLMVLIGLVLVGALFTAYRVWRNWRADAYRREALEALATAETPGAVAEILRRAALGIAPREEIAALQGEVWADWLGRHGAKPPSGAVRSLLARSVYAPSAEPEDFAAVCDFASDWITHHSRPC